MSEPKCAAEAFVEEHGQLGDADLTDKLAEAGATLKRRDFNQVYQFADGSRVILNSSPRFVIQWVKS